MAPHVTRLRSENTNAFEHAEALSRSRAKRQEHRKFFVEGVPTIRQALTHGWVVDALYYAGDVEPSGFARKVLDRSTARRHFELPSRLFDSLRWSRKQEKTSELIALIEMPPEDASRIPVDEDSVVVIFDRRPITEISVRSSARARRSVPPVSSSPATPSTCTIRKRCAQA